MSSEVPIAGPARGCLQDGFAALCASQRRSIRFTRVRLISNACRGPFPAARVEPTDWRSGGLVWLGSSTLEPLGVTRFPFGLTFAPPRWLPKPAGGLDLEFFVMLRTRAHASLSASFLNGGIATFCRAEYFRITATTLQGCQCQHINNMLVFINKKAAIIGKSHSFSDQTRSPPTFGQLYATWTPRLDFTCGAAVGRLEVRYREEVPSSLSLMKNPNKWLKNMP